MGKIDGISARLVAANAFAAAGLSGMFALFAYQQIASLGADDAASLEREIRAQTQQATADLTGAAVSGCGVQASGMWPSPAKRPEVASSPTGPFMYRAADNQSTMGAYVGKTTVKDGKPMMTDWFYADGADYLPSEEEAAKLRPAE